jgi:hypothetical protein
LLRGERFETLLEEPDVQAQVVLIARIGERHVAAPSLCRAARRAPGRAHVSVNRTL